MLDHKKSEAVLPPLLGRMKMWTFEQLLNDARFFLFSAGGVRKMNPSLRLV